MAIAPNFAQAWAALAISRSGLINTANNNSPVQTDGLRVKTAEAAERALALDPRAATAYVALSSLEPRCGSFLRRDELLQKARDVERGNPPLVAGAGCCDPSGDNIRAPIMAG